MAERLPISTEEAAALFATARKSTMTEEDKVRFREERAAYADGRLTEDSEPKPANLSLLSPKDIPEIEAAVKAKIAELMAKAVNGNVKAEELNHIFSRVYTLRRKGLIGDETYGVAEAFFGQSSPISERRED